MIQGLFVRATAFCIWVPAVYLTYCLVQEFTAGQSQIIVGLSMLALFICSCCLIHARYAWQRGNKPEAIGSLAVYVLGAGVLLFLELGFWGSTIAGSHDTVTRAAAAQGGTEMLMQRDREALARGEIPETSAELAARMDAALSQRVGKATLGKATSDCVDTGAPAFRLCREFLDLKAAHAKAAAGEAIEKRIWDAGTRVESSGGLKHDLFAGAQALERSLGGTAETWAAVLSILFVALLMATRDGMLSIVFAPLPRRAAQEPQEAAEPAAASIAPAEVVEAVQPTSEPVQTPPKPRAPRTPPTGGKGKSESIAEDIEEAPEESKVIRFAERPVTAERAELPSFASDVFAESVPPQKLRRPERKHKAMGSSKEWLSSFTERADGVVCPADACWTSYRLWCEAEGMKHLPRSKFERTISKNVGSVSANGKRGYVGLVLLDAVEEKKRAVA